MTQTMTRISTRTAAAAAGACAVLALGLAAPAQAATISSGHWDVVAEVDCAANTIELHAHNHDTGAEEPLTTATTFSVGAGNAVTSTAKDRARFGGTNPFRVLTQDEDQVPNGKLVIGVEAEYAANCGASTPLVTIKRSGSTSTSPAGLRGASYLNSNGKQTQIDTATGSGRNVGVVTNGHEDRRWGFTGAGTYNIGLTATATVGGALRTDTGTIRFSVS